MQKQHFAVLDGLRGVAAIAVVIFHFMEWIITDFKDNFAGHGFLAVDFFFCLSGFVMAYAYDDKIKTIGTSRFIIRRLIRLHPLVFIGSTLGLFGYLLDPFYMEEPTGIVDTFKLFVYSILLIPYPALASKSYNLFGFNAPAWSLFWEYVANLSYVFMLSRIRKHVLVVVLVPAALLLVYVAYRDGNLAGGWSRDNWEVGGIRLAYSFCAGLFVWRKKIIIKNRGGFILPAVLLLLALFSPFFKYNWLAESGIVLFYFPFLISLGAGASTNYPVERICTFLGDVSYPLYMTHYWTLWIFAGYLRSEYFHAAHLPWVVGCSVLLLVLLAYLIMRYIDIPLRRWLQLKVE
ncbi:acyltransferase family protein [Sphingobacterium suaedae]|uniref:Acyltransferase family protein n=1 Tax=Sphingobacterium suaedae TaxID=1686402 RepID=A0ABW5KER5_9SPHI